MAARFPNLIRLALCALPLLALPGARAEETLRFDTDLRLSADAELTVQETIAHDFGQADRHGLFRTIPVKYDRHGSTYTISVHVKDATVDGAKTPVKTTTEGRDIRIRMGDPDRTVRGRHTYRLTYTVRRAVNDFDDVPELYWNAVPTGWPFPIQAASARLYPPAGVSPHSLRLTSFVGRFGGTQPAKTTTAGNSVLFQAQNLNPQEGLTIAARFPAGSVVTPTKDKIAAVLGGWFLALLLPLITLAGIFTRWWHVGRDEEGGQPTAVEWEPPKGLSPAEVGTLMDESVDMEDIVSTLVDLAARGYLTIEVEETKKLLFLSHRDYTFTRPDPKPDLDGLKPHERAFYNALFPRRRQVRLSDLKDKFYTHLPGIRSSIYKELTDLGLFHANPDTTRKVYYGLGVALIAGAVAGMVLREGQMWPLWVGIGLSGVIVAAFAQAMPARTSAGSRALREARGFQRFVRMAEKRRIEVLAKDDPTIFGRLLPYAMVLGVADQWASAFQDLLTEPPEWFVGPYGHGYAFSPHTFINDLGSGMKTMGSTFQSAPSSGGSGGSGFSGGGSGGGFGGGGGGSW